jgi:hypothetical protein
LFVLVILLWVVPSVRAQQMGAVEGRVIDQTGAVLPGVTVDLVTSEGEMTAVSDGTEAPKLASEP